MELRMKGKRDEKKAIIGIALTAIMIASVMVAMVTPAAAFVRDARNVQDATASPGPTIAGELVHLLGPDGVANSGDEPTILRQLQGSPPVPVGYTIIADAVTGNFDTEGAPAGTYQSDIGTFVTLVSPVLNIKLQVGAVEVSIVTAGQRIDVVVNTNIPGAVGTIPPLPPAGGPNDLKLRIIDPDGSETTTGIDAPADDAPAGTMWSVTTSGLEPGHYEFSIKTYTTGSAQAALEIESVRKDIAVVAVSLGVNAEPTTQVVGNDIVITTASNPDVCVIVTVSAPGAFDTTKGDYPTRALPGSTANIFNARMPSDGILKAVISSTTTGAVTIRASVDNNCNWRIDPGETTTDTIDVTFIAVPSSPQNLQVTAGDRYVNLSWSASSDDGGSAITNYLIYRGTTSEGETLLTTVGNVTTYNDTTVDSGQTFFYKVRAKNVAGEGEFSDEASSATTPTPLPEVSPSPSPEVSPSPSPEASPSPSPEASPSPSPEASPSPSPIVTTPSAPQKLRATAGDGYVNLSWSAPSDDGGSAITEYKIYRGTSPGGESPHAFVSANTTSYNDTAVTNNQTYYYQVSAVNSAGEGAKPEEASAIPISVAPPTPPHPWWKSWLVPILIVIAVVVIAIAAILIYKKRGKRGEEKEEKREEAKEEKKRFCMHCGASMLLGAKFCPNCGKEPIKGGGEVKVCKNCGAAIPTEAKFCSVCGAAQPID